DPEGYRGWRHHRRRGPAQDPRRHACHVRSADSDCRCAKGGSTRSGIGADAAVASRHHAKFAFGPRFSADAAAVPRFGADTAACQGREERGAAGAEVLALASERAMTLPEICIKRPVFATVLSLIILLIGLISYTRLSVREYPRIDEPVVSVSTTYRGASAEVVESQVTKPLEDSLAGIEGVELMTSQSRSETSRINVRFTLKRDPDSAAADVRDKVSRARGKLPDTIDEPIIAKVEADSQPIIYIAVEAGSLSSLDASDYVKRYVQPRLSVLPGAADVRIFGERQVSMRINIDRTRLAGYKLTVQ